MKTAILALLLSILLFNGTLFTNISEVGKDKFQSIAKEIDQINLKLGKLKKEENSILNDIYRIELKYEKAVIENNKIKLLLKNTQSKIERRSKEKKELEKEIQKSKKNLTKVLRILYKVGNNAYLKLFIHIKNFDQLFRNYQLFVEIIQYKSEELKNLKENIKRLSVVKKELHIEYNNLKSLQQEKEKKVKLIGGIKQSKMTLIRKINSDREQYTKLLEELEAEANQLNKMIYGKPLKRRLGLLDLEKIKGKLKWPIKGNVISFFGKKKSTKFNTYVLNNGIKIRPGKSDHVKAIYAGELVFADYYKGYGNLIIIQHAKNFYTLYGHCDKVFKKIGDNVNEGEIISTAGDSGSTSGKALYFEIRTHLKPQNPLQWLRKRS